MDTNAPNIAAAIPVCRHVTDTNSSRLDTMTKLREPVCFAWLRIGRSFRVDTQTDIWKKNLTQKETSRLG